MELHLPDEEAEMTVEDGTSIPHATGGCLLRYPQPILPPGRHMAYDVRGCGQVTNFSVDLPDRGHRGPGKMEIAPNQDET